GRAALTSGQLATLEALRHLGPLSRRDLGRKLLRSSGNPPVVVNTLVQRGLVRRARRRDDRRFITVTLTDKGRQLIETLFPRHVALVVREMGLLSPREQAELGRLCRLVGRREGRGRGRKEIGDGTVRDAVGLARAL